MDNEKYKLVGILNSIGYVPNIVIPVFIGANKKLYWAVTSNDETDKVKCLYQSFSELPQIFVNEVKMISNCIAKTECIQDYYKVGDLPVCGIEIEENGLYIGRIDKYLEFINYYRTDFIASNVSAYEECFIKRLDKEIELIREIVEEAKELGVLDKRK